MLLLSNSNNNNIQSIKQLDKTVPVDGGMLIPFRGFLTVHQMRNILSTVSGFILLLFIIIIIHIRIIIVVIVSMYALPSQLQLKPVTLSSANNKFVLSKCK